MYARAVDPLRGSESTAPALFHFIHQLAFLGVAHRGLQHPEVPVPCDGHLRHGLGRELPGLDLIPRDAAQEARHGAHRARLVDVLHDHHSGVPAPHTL